MNKELENLAYNERPDYQKILYFSNLLENEEFLSRAIAAFDIYLSSLNSRKLNAEEIERVKFISENLAAFLDMNNETLQINR